MQHRLWDWTAGEIQKSGKESISEFGKRVNQKVQAGKMVSKVLLEAWKMVIYGGIKYGPDEHLW